MTFIVRPSGEAWPACERTVCKKNCKTREWGQQKWWHSTWNAASLKLIKVAPVMEPAHFYSMCFLIGLMPVRYRTLILTATFLHLWSWFLWIWTGLSVCVCVPVYAVKWGPNCTFFGKWEHLAGFHIFERLHRVGLKVKVWVKVGARTGFWLV